jgi:hypothetical protein
MGNEVSTHLSLEDRMMAIQKVSDETSISKLHALPQTMRALKLVVGLKQMRNLFDGEILDQVMELMDSNLGFRTDRSPGTRDKAGNEVKPYPRNVVRDCVIEGLLRGANMIGNEINIISGRCYLTKEYYERIVRELVSDLRVTEGVPQMSQGGALVPMRASWIFEGRHDSIECIKTDSEDRRIPVRVNANMGADAIVGKAYRKLYAKIHRRVTGSTWLEEDTSDTPIEVGPADYMVQQHVSEDDNKQPAQMDEVHHEEPQRATFIGIEDILSAMDSISDVTKYETSFAAIMDSEEDRAKLHDWCEWRRDQIRETRGQRANGK